MTTLISFLTAAGTKLLLAPIYGLMTKAIVATALNIVGV